MTRHTNEGGTVRTTMNERIRGLLSQPFALLASIAALAVIVAVYADGRVLAATILLVVFGYAWSARPLVEYVARRLPALPARSRWESSAEATAALVIALPLALAGALASFGRGYWDLVACAFALAMFVTVIASWEPTHRMRQQDRTTAESDDAQV
ncbi:MAG: hypothetical protein LC798_11790 [Chloroflexi bacterium]|nr:hypothetical protein [Chloroflexota bacterium]